MTFLEELHKQRWDDHRFYHHNRINQFLHLLSACCFLLSYVLIFYSPATAALVGWLLSMGLRQSGHFFFEPLSYDNVNKVSHQYKESIKLGYNLQRKVVLITIWASLPIVLFFQPTLFGFFDAHSDVNSFINNMAIAWLFIGIAAVIFRTIHLFKLKSIQTGLVWFTKILTDPFHDIKMYHKSWYYLLKGEMYDNMADWHTEMPSKQ